MKRCISITLTFLLLLSNMGLAIGTHFCMGEAVETSLLYGSAHDPLCGMMEAACYSASSDAGNEKYISAPPCCENQYQVVKLDEKATHQLVQTDFSPLPFIAAFLHSFILQILPEADLNSGFAAYQPPQPEQDFRALFQTYLI